MKWIKLHHPGGEPVLVNFDMVEQVNGCGRSGECTKVFYPRTDEYGDTEFIVVRESLEEIETILTGKEAAKQPDERGAVKQSQWSIDEYGDCTCENCGYEASYDTDYCPGCGAWMNREVSNED